MFLSYAVESLFDATCDVNDKCMHHRIISNIINADFCVNLRVIACVWFKKPELMVIWVGLKRPLNNTICCKICVSNLSKCTQYWQIEDNDKDLKNLYSYNQLFYHVNILANSFSISHVAKPKPRAWNSGYCR